MTHNLIKETLVEHVRLLFAPKPTAIYIINQDFNGVSVRHEALEHLVNYLICERFSAQFNYLKRSTSDKVIRL